MTDAITTTEQLINFYRRPLTDALAGFGYQARPIHQDTDRFTQNLSDAVAYLVNSHEPCQQDAGETLDAALPLIRQARHEIHTGRRAQLLGQAAAHLDCLEVATQALDLS